MDAFLEPLVAVHNERRRCAAATKAAAATRPRDGLLNEVGDDFSACNSRKDVRQHSVGGGGEKEGVIPCRTNAATAAPMSRIPGALPGILTVSDGYFLEDNADLSTLARFTSAFYDYRVK